MSVFGDVVVTSFGAFERSPYFLGISLMQLVPISVEPLCQYLEYFFKEVDNISSLEYTGIVSCETLLPLPTEKVHKHADRQVI